MAASAALLLCGGLPAQAQLVQVHNEAFQLIYQATGTHYVQCPRAISFDAPNAGGAIVKNIVVNWGFHGDFPPWDSPLTSTYSSDAGVSYAAPINTPPDVDLSAVTRRSDGTILAFPFWPKYPPTLPTTTFTSYYFTSSDKGATWTRHGTLDVGTGTITGGGSINFGAQTVAGMRVTEGIIQETDGSYYAPIYAVFTGDKSWRAGVIKSTDSGVTWTYFSTIKLPTATANYTETSIVRCLDGSWLALMRSDGYTLNPAPILELVQARSTDQGLNWTYGGVPSGLAGTSGVMPFLRLMPNGILVLGYGNMSTVPGARRSDRLTFSSNGNGTSWSNQIETYSGVPGGQQSTGYNSVVPLGAHEFMDFIDTGTSWSYPTNPFPSPNPFSIKQTRVALVRTQRNRIDLANKVAAGAVTVTTDLTYTNATNPEAKVAGAYDGSIDLWSGAFKSATTGSYTIDLQTSQTLTAVGVCLKYNTAESATIDYSTNGTSWTTLKTYTNAKHNAIDYTTSTITARYVRVNITGGTSPIALHEVELYSNADTFENYAYGTVPFGYTSPNAGFWVTDVITPLPSGYQSKRALIMYDGQTAAQPTCSKTTTATTSKTLEFMYRSKTFAPSGAHQFLIRSGTTNVYHLAVFSDGSIRYFNGSWVVLAAAGTVPADTWTDIKTVATISPATASVYVNGVLKGTALKENTGPTTMDNLQFATSGTAPIGDTALLDDIAF